jgi:hypothetical protein
MPPGPVEGEALTLAQARRAELELEKASLTDELLSTSEMRAAFPEVVDEAPSGRSLRSYSQRLANTFTNKRAGLRSVRSTTEEHDLVTPEMLGLEIDSAPNHASAVARHGVFAPDDFLPSGARNIKVNPDTGQPVKGILEIAETSQDPFGLGVYGLTRRIEEDLTKKGIDIRSTFSTAQRNLAKAQAERNPILEAMRQEWVAGRHAWLDVYVDEGILTPAARDEIKRLNPNYVPRRIVDVRGFLPAEQRPLINDPFRKAKGGGDEVIDPIAATIAEDLYHTQFIQKYRLGQLIADIGDQSGSGVRRVERPKGFEMKSDTSDLPVSFCASVRG